MSKQLVKIEEMTDGELEAEAERRERAGEVLHAAEVRHYLKMRPIHGPDPRTWPAEALPK
jgi:hypothetical protein